MTPRLSFCSLTLTLTVSTDPDAGKGVEHKQKRSRIVGRWSTRYFILEASPPRLLWYTSVKEYEDGFPPKNHISLKGASVGASLPPSLPRRGGNCAACGRLLTFNDQITGGRGCCCCTCVCLEDLLSKRTTRCGSFSVRAVPVPRLCVTPKPQQ
jgi:hypothetical protein